MKCIILAGGMGERLWPLSRQNFPKQFVRINRNHSIFQETIARNIPFCDEFIIITNYEYRFIIDNQMQSFQGINYRCIYEQIPRKTTVALALACFSLPLSELVFVVPSDHIIDTKSLSVDNKLNYKDSILKAKELAKDDKIVLFGVDNQTIDKRYGYYIEKDEKVSFFEKPDDEMIKKLRRRKNVCQNLGMLVFQNGLLLDELKKKNKTLYKKCESIFNKRTVSAEGSLYEEELLKTVKGGSIEKEVLEHTDKLCGITVCYKWHDVGRLEDLEEINFDTKGIGIKYNCDNSVVYNQSTQQAVVVNEVDDVIVLNTSDAVYIGKKGESHKLKDILHNNKKLDEFAYSGTTTYRKWGIIEKLIEEEGYRVRKVTLRPGKTIYEHLHEKRKENWTIIHGRVLITIDGVSSVYKEMDNIDISTNITHQISNIGDDDAIFIETAVGEILHSIDTFSDSSDTVSEVDLGMIVEPLVRLRPAFKDYIWGGTKIKKVFNKKSDLDIIAESWELSSHPAGNSIVDSGKHKGMRFSRYLESVGYDVLGWKCNSLQRFPLLVKFIDAKDNLSIQVHPNDDYALVNENEYGKNEMWYVVDSLPGSGSYVGFNKDMSKQEITKRIKDNTIMDYLNFYETKKGDVFFIPAGTVHAIGSGNLICEIQQSSNSTYRLYDYNRKDKYGNERELHLDKALDVIDCNKYVLDNFDSYEHNGIKTVGCKYFETNIIDVTSEKKIYLTDDSFRNIICINGSGIINIKNDSIKIKAGDSIFVPATNSVMTIDGNMSVIIIKV